MAEILVVEDDKNQRLLLEEELGTEGYEVAGAADGNEALDKISHTMPDLVVVDISMPGMDGLELLGRVLAINNQLPVVIHTAYVSYKDSFMSWAADAYVVKRGDLSELKGTIRRILAERRRAATAEAGGRA